MPTLSERIKFLRQSANMTQMQFGEKFGIVKSTVSLYESGKSTPNDEIKKKICEYFNVSLDYLLGVDNFEQSNPKTFGNKLRLLRRKKGITQTELGEKMGVVKQTISSWENDISEPSKSVLIQLANIFEVTPSYLIDPNYNSTSQTIKTDNALTAKEFNLLNAFNQLDEDNQDIAIGKIKELLKEQRMEKWRTMELQCMESE